MCVRGLRGGLDLGVVLMVPIHAVKYELQISLALPFALCES